MYKILDKEFETFEEALQHVETFGFTPASKYYAVAFNEEDKLLACEDITRFLKVNEFLESQDFYNLMQSYRLAPISKQSEVISAFEEVKKAILESFNK